MCVVWCDDQFSVVPKGGWDNRMEKSPSVSPSPRSPSLQHNTHQCIEFEYQKKKAKQKDDFFDCKVVLVKIGKVETQVTKCMYVPSYLSTALNNCSLNIGLLPSLLVHAALHQMGFSIVSV